MQSLECPLKDISAKKAAKKFIQRAGLIAILFSGGEEGSAQESVEKSTKKNQLAYDKPFRTHL